MTSLATTTAARESRDATCETLSALLETNPDSTVAQVLARLEQRAPRIADVVLVGGGQVGRWMARELPKLGINVRCFADNSSAVAGHDVDGLAALTPAEAVRQHRDATFVVTVFNPAQLIGQLESLGARSVVPWTWLAWAHGAELLPYFGLDLPHGMVAAADEILRTHDLLADEQSRRVLLDQVRWRLTLDSDAQDPPSAFEHIYAEPGVCRPTQTDVYVDCGAFDGDSIAMHLERTGGVAAGVVAIEADPGNLAALRARIDALPHAMAERVVVHAVAVGARRERATFRATGTAGSSLQTSPGDVDAGFVEVDVMPLDELLAGIPASYVKMDVEGAEPLALQGARQTLAAGTAVWSVCLYHAADHLWSIPLQIAESGGDYRHAMRRYAQDCWELVHYAVPAGRS